MWPIRAPAAVPAAPAWRTTLVALAALLELTLALRLESLRR